MRSPTLTPPLTSRRLTASSASRLITLKVVSQVKNPGMERGYQINVERGFDAIVANARASTLLNHIDALDKQLEAPLVAQKTATIKIISNLRKPEKPPSGILLKYELPHLLPTIAESQPSASNQPVTYSAEQKAQAQSRREAETRQLESRLGRLPKFTKSLNGLEYTVPIEPRNALELPGDLKAINTTSLIVPALYNLETCRIELRGVDGEAKTNVERAFQKRVLHYPQMTPTNHVNYLSQNMHTMVTQKQITKFEIPRNAPQSYSQPTTAQIAQGLSNPRSSDDNSTLPPHEVPDRAPIQTTRLDLTPMTAVKSKRKPNQGHLTESHKLLQLDTRKRDGAGTRSETCKKCANSLGISFRTYLIHSNSIRAGTWTSMDVPWWICC